MYSISRFQQIIKPVMNGRFARHVRTHQADKHSKGFGCQNLLVCMLYARLGRCASLRTPGQSFNAHSSHHYHLNMRSIRRSTLSEALAKRDTCPFADMLIELISLCGRTLRKQTGDYMDISFEEQQFQSKHAFVGVELVPNTRRLALMNCLLHDIEGGLQGAVLQGNTLGETGKRLKSADIILANPPFGTSKGGDAAITRDDLTYETTNKQLAFLQHIYRNLKEGGRAAVVLPDNVLFEAGKGTDIRHDLMNKCNLHTILRLPTGIFYAQGVKTNVLFFNKVSNHAENSTQQVWVYDLRTNMPSFGKRTPFTEHHLAAFEQVFDPTSAVKFNDENLQEVLHARKEGEWSFTEGEHTAENSRWRCFSREWIAENKGDSLDISWLKDKSAVDSEDLPEPLELIGQAKNELETALLALNKLMRELN